MYALINRVVIFILKTLGWTIAVYVVGEGCVAVYRQLRAVPTFLAKVREMQTGFVSAEEIARQQAEMAAEVSDKDLVTFCAMNDVAEA